MRRHLRDFGLGALAAIVIATVAFVAYRNHELVDRQTRHANAAVTDAMTGRTAMPGSRAVFVSRATPSTKHSFLSRRTIAPAGGPLVWRPLTPGSDPDAKLLYDTATRLEKITPARIVELLPDGTGRAIAAASAADHIVIAITAPARPAPYPWVVMLGVFGLGAALTAAGALVGGRPARVGTFAGIGVLAIPTILWGSVIAATLIIVIAAGLAFAQHRNLTDRFIHGVREHRTTLGFLGPAAISMLVLVAAPFVIGLFIGFYDHHHGSWTFVGLSNFGELLSGGGRALDDPLNFWFIVGVTVLWTVVNVTFHVLLGVLLALLLTRPWLRAKGMWRMLFIVPWAVPNYITALIWKGMFEGEYGAINSLLDLAGLDGVTWFGSWIASFSANVITNTWLGFPFMLVVAIGALESIPKEQYEAAAVDGASAWQRFRHITLPYLRPALGPAIVLGSIWTFNMFNVIHLVSGGAPGGSTNTLVTDAYRWAFDRGERYGMAAAEGTLIFLILLLWNVFGKRLVRAKGATE
jgi:ABC-type sugar transport system permease subunit